MSYVETQHDDKLDAWFASMERDEGCTEPTKLLPATAYDVPKAFGGAYEAPKGVMYGSDLAGAVLRAAQYGQAAVLDALAEADPECFALKPFADEAGGLPTDLIAQALSGFWITSERFGGTPELAHQYYATVLALLNGGASPRITSVVSLFAAWPVVLMVNISSGIRLEGWASKAHEAACWAWLEAFGPQAAAAGAAAQDAEAAKAAERVALA